MASNYDSEYGAPNGFQPPHEELPSWNTWTTRSVLKSLSGLFLISPVLFFTLNFISPLNWFFGDTWMVSFIIGLILWGVFYEMEREYRRVTPDRIR